MVHMGRYTAALLLIATGVALVLDQTTGSRYLSLFIDWWPMIFIMLGAEVILLSMAYKNNGAKLRFSFGSVFGAAVIAVLVLLMTGFGEEKFEMKNLRFWEYGWKQYEMPVERIAVGSDTRLLRINNTNGKVMIRSGDTEQVDIQTVVRYSNFLSEEEAQAVERESTLRISEGETLEITAEGKEYRQFFWRQRALMDLTITIPLDRELNVHLELTNGDVMAADLGVADQLVVRTSNGDIEVRSVAGSVNVSTRNGDIHVTDIDSSTLLETSNGDIYVENVRAAVDATTSNGDVEVYHAASSLDIGTSNGDIAVQSSTIGGNWKIDTTNGDILICVPDTGDYRIRGFGDIDTSLDWLNVDQHAVEGLKGTGLHFIEAETNNGDLEIEYYKNNE